MRKSGIDYKFKEPEYLEELAHYVDETYRKHYGKGKYQAMEEIIDDGHGMGFAMGNIKKYAKRAGKKGTLEDHRADLMKVLHYSLLALYVFDLEQTSNSSMDTTEYREKLRRDIEALRAET